MNYPSKVHVIILDDSKLDCFIAEKLFKNTGKAESIKSFFNGNQLLEYLRTEYPRSDSIPTIIIVDIRMAIMNGFEFIEAFKKVPKEISKNCKIHPTFSPFTSNDFERLRSLDSDNLGMILHKPLTSNQLIAILS